MRLSKIQIEVILESVRSIVEKDVRVSVFGSRLKDDVKGGDLDLFLESREKITLIQKARIKNIVEKRISIPVDIIAVKYGEAITPFQEIAREHSQAL